MAKTMKAAIVRKFKEPLSIVEVPVPEVGRGQILVKIEACGVCHTDLHAADGDWPVKPKPPFIPGHEGVGTVSAAGRDVTAVKEGDRVGVPWLYTACGHCRHCLAAWETLCDSQQNTGYSVNGGFAEYTLADPNYVGHLPNGLDFEPAAPILCAGVTVYKGLKETEGKPGDAVVISGIGGLGHVAVQYAKAMGLSVIAVDISDEKLSLARKMGADAVVNAMKADAVAEGNKLCGGGGGGTMPLFGLPPGSFELDIFNTVLMGKTIRGSIVGTRLDLAECLQFAGEGKVKVHYSTERLEDINSIFGRRRNYKIDGRVVMKI